MLTLASCDAVLPLLTRYNLVPTLVAAGTSIPGSYWGEREAGLIGDRLYFRSDTPLHSVLHEACHYICMDEARRTLLEQDAGGDYDEENAVCYLQILLAGELPECSRERMCADMDAWGYTFRLGSAMAWFDHDAEDARRWLIGHDLIGKDGRISWKKRGAAKDRDQRKPLWGKKE
jgi:hypothetical protein